MCNCRRNNLGVGGPVAWGLLLDLGGPGLGFGVPRTVPFGTPYADSTDTRPGLSNGG